MLDDRHRIGTRRELDRDVHALASRRAGDRSEGPVAQQRDDRERGRGDRPGPEAEAGGEPGGGRDPQRRGGREAPDAVGPFQDRARSQETDAGRDVRRDAGDVDLHVRRRAARDELVERADRDRAKERRAERK